MPKRNSAVVGNGRGRSAATARLEIGEEGGKLGGPLALASFPAWLLIAVRDQIWDDSPRRRGAGLGGCRGRAACGWFWDKLGSVWQARGSEMVKRRLMRAMPAALVLILVVAADALAAARLQPGALYVGKDSDCASNVRGTTCMFRFRAGHDGRSLKFVGKTVIDTWGCRNGGGEALLGGELKFATPIPLVEVRANGTLHGSHRYVVRPSVGAPNHYVSSVSGHVAKGGRTAVITFHNVYVSSHGSEPCATQPVTLNKAR